VFSQEEMDRRVALDLKAQQEADTLKEFKDHLTLWEFHESTQKLDDQLFKVFVN
jgi:hypothetical protein